MDLALFPFVFRFRSPAGLRGQRCRRVALTPVQRDRDGHVLYHCGDEIVAIEFPDGRRENVSRSAIVAASSRLGRQTVARLARGDIPMAKARRAAMKGTR